MSTSTIISSVKSILLPDTTPQIRRPAKRSTAAKQSQALESNASENQSLVPDNSIDGEYVEATASLERKVEPISRAILSSPATSMQQLHEMAKHELNVLDALNNEGRQIIKKRLMAIWGEMSVRLEQGESINGISGTGGKGMGKYLRSIGVDPAQRRSWKFEIRRQDTLRLAQENPPIKGKRSTTKEIVIHSETEADLIAKAGVRMAQKLVSDGMTTPQERINNAEEMAKDILEAIADGQYDLLKPLPPPTATLMPGTATYEDWRKHQLPAPEYKRKYFGEASGNLQAGYLQAFSKRGFKELIQMLRDKPDQVVSNAQDFAQLATVLRGVAENANLLVRTQVRTARSNRSIMPNNSRTFAERSAAAQKAAATRKRNKHEEKRDEAIQSARRQYLYYRLTNAERESIERALLRAISGLEDEFEKWFNKKLREAKEIIRNLLREGVKAAIILASLENTVMPVTILAWPDSFNFNLAILLDEVRLESEFSGINGSTFDECCQILEGSHTHVSENEVPGIDESQYDIPPALEDEEGVPGFMA